MKPPIRAGSHAHRLLSAACAEPRALRQLRAKLPEYLTDGNLQGPVARLVAHGLLSIAPPDRPGAAVRYALTRAGERVLDQLWSPDLA